MNFKLLIFNLIKGALAGLPFLVIVINDQSYQRPVFSLGVYVLLETIRLPWEPYRGLVFWASFTLYVFQISVDR